MSARAVLSLGGLSNRAPAPKFTQRGGRIPGAVVFLEARIGAREPGTSARGVESFLQMCPSPRSDSMALLIAESQLLPTSCQRRGPTEARTPEGGDPGAT